MRSCSSRYLARSSQSNSLQVGAVCQLRLTTDRLLLSQYLRGFLAPFDLFPLLQLGHPAIFFPLLLLSELLAPFLGLSPKFIDCSGGVHEFTGNMLIIRCQIELRTSHYKAIALRDLSMVADAIGPWTLLDGLRSPHQGWPEVRFISSYCHLMCTEFVGVVSLALCCI